MPTTLWLRETESSEALSSLAPAPTSESCVESYVRDDGPGGLALCEAEEEKFDRCTSPSSARRIGRRGRRRCTVSGMGARDPSFTSSRVVWPISYG